MIHEKIVLPDSITSRVKTFMNEMGLNFAVFDFVKTQSSEILFLECNPNGQWLWLEFATGVKISDASIRFFLRND